MAKYAHFVFLTLAMGGLILMSTGCPSSSSGGKSDSSKGDYSEYTKGEVLHPDLGNWETPNTYQEDEGSLTFQYPDDWTITETLPGSLVTLQGPTDNVAMTVSKGTYVKGMEKISYEAFVIENNKKTQASTNYRTYDKGTLNGNYCIFTEFLISLIPPPESKEVVIEVENQMFIIFHKDQVYTVTFDGLKKEYSSYSNPIYSIAKTIRFTD